MRLTKFSSIVFGVTSKLPDVNKGRGKVDLYSAFLSTSLSMCWGMDYTVLHHTCLYFVSVHQMSPPLIVVADI